MAYPPPLHYQPPVPELYVVQRQTAGGGSDLPAERKLIHSQRRGGGLIVVPVSRRGRFSLVADSARGGFIVRAY